MAKEDLETEFSQIKSSFKVLQTQFNILNDKHEALEKKYDEAVSNKRQVFKCSICDENFNSSANLKKHRGIHETTVWSFQCDECERVFNEEWKLTAHSKQHVKYACDLCDQTFKTEEVKKIHNKIVHENLKLYCHYYNNGKNCPYDQECGFLHTVAVVCKYGDLCDRQMCMFRHSASDDVIIEVIEDEN